MAKSYSNKLKDPRWQKKRLEILERDKWTCQLCSDKETTLNIHHIKYTGKNPWDAPMKDLITYCEVCHGFIEETGNRNVIRIGKIKIGKDHILMVCIYGGGTSMYSCIISKNRKNDYNLAMSLFNPQLEQLKDLLNGS